MTEENHVVIVHNRRLTRTSMTGNWWSRKSMPPSWTSSTVDCPLSTTTQNLPPTQVLNFISIKNWAKGFGPVFWTKPALRQLTKSSHKLTEESTTEYFSYFQKFLKVTTKLWQWLKNFWTPEYGQLFRWPLDPVVVCGGPWWLDNFEVLSRNCACALKCGLLWNSTQCL